MKIVLVFSIIITALLLIGKQVFYSTKRNLIKNHTAWSGKDIKMIYNKSNQVRDTKNNDNYLKVIANESKIYLDNQNNTEEEWKKFLNVNKRILKKQIKRIYL